MNAYSARLSPRFSSNSISFAIINDWFFFYWLLLLSFLSFFTCLHSLFLFLDAKAETINDFNIGWCCLCDFCQNHATRWMIVQSRVWIDWWLIFAPELNKSRMCLLFCPFLRNDCYFIILISIWHINLLAQLWAQLKWACLWVRCALIDDTWFKFIICVFCCFCCWNAVLCKQMNEMPKLENCNVAYREKPEKLLCGSLNFF